ncbi:MAG: bifunctional acetate--CoA ligase family protein/GNAT family N-acetyltransferase [Chlamydiota bacterium]
MNEEKKHFHKTDPSQNFISQPHEPLDAIFKPQNIAVIGAKDDLGTVGRTIMANLLDGSLGERIYPVNPKRDTVLGIKTYPDVSSIPEAIDLAIIITPAETVPKIVEQCVETGVKSSIIISAGFKEIGHEGLEMEKEVVRIARSGNMPIIGPNCLGVMSPQSGLNATFAKGMAHPGNLAFISQSGAMCTAVLDWSFKENIGFSAFVSIGSMADVDWGDLIHYFGNDPKTKSILMYMETVGDPRTFLTAAREIALEKPIIVIKGGRSPDAAQAAASHTGSLAGSDEVFDAALLRAGVLRVDTISELFDMASVLARQPLPKGPNLAIITNAGGPSVLATDATVLNGAKIAKLQKNTIEQLDEFLPPAWSHGNPVDILGDALADRFGTTIRIVANDENVDGLLVVLSPQDVTDPNGTAEYMREFAHLDNKPILASWMGGDTVLKGAQTLHHSGIPSFSYPDDAAWSFAKMWDYSLNLRSIYETPSVRDDTSDFFSEVPSIWEVDQIIQKARREKRDLLDEYESKKILACYNIPIVETLKAKSCEEAVEQANKLRYPVVVKLYSKTITHKTDVGGVKLNLTSDDDVSKAFNDIQQSVTEKEGADAFDGVTVQRMVKIDGYELILGCSCDEQFGPVLLFGTGGQLVEVYKDRSLGLPPLNTTLARRMMQQTKIYTALKGVRGREAVDMKQLEEVLVHFSQLIVENPRIKELDINPLLVSADEIIALDARVVLHDPDLPEEDLPSTSIRPYPIQYIQTIHLKNDVPVLLRPIKAEDEPMIAVFHKELSENTVRQRYFEFLSLDERTTHERLVHICFNDYARELALVAEVNEKKIVGIARLRRIPGTEEATMTITIIDAYHGKGLGIQMLQHLIEMAKQENIKTIKAAVLSENVGMLALCEKCGFDLKPCPEEHLTYCELECIKLL